MTGAFLAFCRVAKASNEGVSYIPQGDRATLTKLGVLREEVFEIREAVARVGLTDVYRTPLS